MQEIHQFDNHIKVYKHHLLDLQTNRYQNINLHEPEEEKWFLQMLEYYQNTSHPIFLDIGAAIGYYSILAKKTIPNLQIHAFEPFQTHVQYMRDNILLNNLSMDDIKVHEVAISDTTGKSQFQLDTFSSVLINTPSQNFFRRLLKKQEVAPNITSVQTISLDNFCSNLNHDISLAKIDVQGFEIQVLRGAKQALQKKQIKTWIIGTHSSQLHQDCLTLLQNDGYSIYFEEVVVENQPDGIIVAHV
ncbi:MAG: FkbM family methyltransferase [Anaerolineae bacterium]|nr:FkbM family methyltransferase [Anaerolineae bacterium]